MKIHYWFLCLFLMIGCKPDPENLEEKVSKKEQDPERITAKDIEKIQYTDYVLSPDAATAVQSWQQYQELMVQIDFLKKADFSFFGGKNDLMMNFLKDLKKDIPSNLSSPAIKERLIALETKILRFHSSLKLSKPKKETLLKDIKEILVASSNLHLQMNKKFELESQVIHNPSAN